MYLFNNNKFVATKKGKTTNFSPSFVAVVGSRIEIRDPGWIKIRIADKYPRSATLLILILNFSKENSKITYVSITYGTESLVLPGVVSYHCAKLFII